MKLIAITSDAALEREAEAIALLLSSGFDRVHIRKPSWKEADFCQLIEAIPEIYYPRLSLHDNHHLAIKYGLGAVHLNSRNPRAPINFHGIVSRSCHSINEAAVLDCDYCFLSPVFDSISKVGYHSAFNHSDLQQALATRLSGRQVYALGGINHDNLDEVCRLGFAGAAMLGALWGDGRFETVKNNIEQIDKWKDSNI